MRYTRPAGVQPLSRLPLVAKLEEPVIRRAGAIQSPPGAGHGHTQRVDEIPARVALPPFTGVGIVEVAVQGVAGHFVVESQGVVAHPAGARSGQLGVNTGDELRLRRPSRVRQLRSNAGEQAGFRVG